MDRAAARPRPPVAPQQLAPVHDTAGEVAERAGDEPGGEAFAHGGPDAIVRERMAAGVKTTVTELPESRVRVEAEVTPEEVQRAVEQTARQLGTSMRIPGFRKGKVPPPVIIRRIGRDAVLDEAVRDAIGGWYVDAIGDANIAPVGDPKLDLGDLPAEGQPLTFTIEIGVRPEATLGTYEMDKYLMELLILGAVIGSIGVISSPGRSPIPWIGLALNAMAAAVLGLGALIWLT